MNVTPEQGGPAGKSEGGSSGVGRDIVVIGASAGGVDALQQVVRNLPPDLPAAIFVVVHVSPDGPGLLPFILENAGPLPASQPRDGQIIEMGRIYVAPPNYHMMLEGEIIRVARGPKQNRHRPAIDPLFRSAARHYGPRVVGVVLTGMLDDGSAGLLAVKRMGGTAVVQDPLDALYPAMPTNALDAVRDVDYVVPLGALAPLLVRLASEPASAETPDAGEAPTNEEGISMAEKMGIEDEFSMSALPPEDQMNKLGKPATIACPECHGTLWEIDDGKLLRFQCRIGHSYTVKSLLSEHAESLETALWVAVRTLEESASLNRRLAERARAGNQLLSASSFMEAAVEAEQQADIIKRVLISNRAVDEQNEDVG